MYSLYSTVATVGILILIAKLLIDVVTLAIAPVNLGNLHATSGHPQEVVGLELVNLVKEAVESAQNKTRSAFSFSLSHSLAFR